MGHAELQLLKAGTRFLVALERLVERRQLYGRLATALQDHEFQSAEGHARVREWQEEHGQRIFDDALDEPGRLLKQTQNLTALGDSFARLMSDAMARLAGDRIGFEKLTPFGARLSAVIGSGDYESRVDQAVISLLDHVSGPPKHAVWASTPARGDERTAQPARNIAPPDEATTQAYAERARVIRGQLGKMQEFAQNAGPAIENAETIFVIVGRLVEAELEVQRLRGTTNYLIKANATLALERAHRDRLVDSNCVRLLEACLADQRFRDHVKSLKADVTRIRERQGAVNALLIDNHTSIQTRASVYWETIEKDPEDLALDVRVHNAGASLLLGGGTALDPGHREDWYELLTVLEQRIIDRADRLQMNLDEVWQNLVDISGVAPAAARAPAEARRELARDDSLGAGSTHGETGTPPIVETVDPLSDGEKEAMETPSSVMVHKIADAARELGIKVPPETPLLKYEGELVKAHWPKRRKDGTLGTVRLTFNRNGLAEAQSTRAMGSTSPGAVDPSRQLTVD